MNWRLIALQRIGPTAATVIFGANARENVIPKFPENLPWDPFVPWVSLGCGLFLIWLVMSVICAGVRLSALQLHWVPRWMAYTLFTFSALAMPFMLFGPSFMASTICADGCDVGANWDGFIATFDKAIPPNALCWPIVAPLTIVVAAWMAYLERRLTLK